ncbi:MAG: replicative DNA helicase [Cyclobacteriaceae bacterium]|nr:replicative DNA helicase [Cyclobacteriaceae bacterium]MCH8514703.1 replicative DNA helicase [Cyclobacteriaceae bacterium]
MNESSNTKAYKDKSSNWSDNNQGLSLVGKIPPQAPELEQAVLGALMLERDPINVVVDILKPDSFYKQAHRDIYTAIVSLFNNSEPIDILTVTQQLRKEGTLERAGGAYYISQLTARVQSAANIETHARVVAEMSMKRELISIATEIQEDAFDDTADIFQMLDKVQQQLFEVTQKNIRKNYADIQNVLRQAIDELESRKDKSDGLTGIPSGFKSLDRMTNGWQKSDLVIIAARPAMGKTAFVLSTLRNAAVDFGQPVAIFSLEMSAVQLVNRLISAEAELESDKIKKGNLADYEWEQLLNKTTRLAESKIFIDDTPALSILELRAKCRRLKAQHDVQMIVIDYLQLMSGDTSKGAGNREQEIASISRALKQIAKELSVPVLALSQLSRAVESRGGDKKPMLSDLRESGSIEQDADMVMFLYRPAYYGMTEVESEETQGLIPADDLGQVIIAKHRNGEVGTVDLKFIGKYIKFTNRDGLGMIGESRALPAAGFSPVDSGMKTFGSKMNQEGEANSDTNLTEEGDDAPF